MDQDQILAELSAMIAQARCGPDQDAMVTLKQHIEGTVVVQPPPGGEWNGKCSNYPNTVYHKFEWSEPGNMLVDTRGSLGGGILVCSFVTPDAGPTIANSVMSFSVTAFPGGEPTPQRRIAVNPLEQSCDFNVGPKWLKPVRGGTGTLYLGYESDGGHGYGVMRRNTRYFVMVANDGGRKGEIRLEINKPQGL